jgi:hypothetical protein
LALGRIVARIGTGFQLVAPLLDLTVEGIDFPIAETVELDTYHALDDELAKLFDNPASTRASFVAPTLALTSIDAHAIAAGSEQAQSIAAETATVFITAAIAVLAPVVLGQAVIAFGVVFHPSGPLGMGRA